MFRKAKIIILSLLSLTLNSCLNEYEKEVIGKYDLREYKLKDPLEKTSINPILSVNKNKTFILEFKNKVISGTWEANDNGDWTYIEFTYGNDKIEGRIGTDEIHINSPYNFGIENVESLDFKRFYEDLK